MRPIYDDIGINYASNRQTDPRIAGQIQTLLKGARRILNIGAGSGSYEPEEADLVALEPSSAMIAQRKPESHPVIQGVVEQLPFEDDSFSHAMSILSMHHWENQAKAFGEINRVATDRFVALTWNPEAEPFWLTRDYFPEFHQRDKIIFPSVGELSTHFETVEAYAVPIPDDCVDGFMAAYWKRPEAYLDEGIRASISAFARLSDPTEGLRRLESDIKSGRWEEKNRAILDQSPLDAGFIIVSAQIENA